MSSTVVCLAPPPVFIVAVLLQLAVPAGRLSLLPLLSGGRLPALSDGAAVGAGRRHCRRLSAPVLHARSRRTRPELSCFYVSTFRIGQASQHVYDALTAARAARAGGGAMS